MVAEDAVTYASPAGGPDLTLVGRAGDEGVLGQLRRSSGRYEADIVEVLRRRVRPGDVVVDVGANIGPITLVMSRLAGALGSVVAFEPAPENAGFLRRNLEANGATNAHVVEAAASDHVGTVGFEFNEAYPAGSFVSDSAQGSVVSTTIDATVEDLGLTRVDVVKVDVEGAELEALRGARETIARFGPDLVVELNPIALGRFHGARWRELVAVLRDASDDLRVIDRDGSMAPVLSEHHIALELANRGIVDLIGIGRSRSASVPERLAARSVGAARYARTLARHRSRRCPDIAFVAEPAVRFDVVARELAGGPGDEVAVRVRVSNLGPTWLSSDFAFHPVHVGARWIDAAGEVVGEAGRSRFEQPVAPGREASVALRVALPGAHGEHHLAITLVQEHFAWFDDVDRSARAIVPAFVR